MIRRHSNVTAAAMKCQLLGMVTMGHGLVLGNNLPFIARRTASPRRPSSPMVMYIDDAMPVTRIDVPSLSYPLSPATSTASLPANHSTPASNPSSSDPQQEEEDMWDAAAMAIVFGCDSGQEALSVPTLLGPNTVWLRWCNVGSRFLTLVADGFRDAYLDEWAFHVTMLAITLRLFLSTAQPLLLAARSVSSLPSWDTSGRGAAVSEDARALSSTKCSRSQRNTAVGYHRQNQNNHRM